MPNSNTAPSTARPTREIASAGRHTFETTPTDRAHVAALQARSLAAFGKSISFNQALRIGLIMASRDPDAALLAAPRVHGGRPKSPLNVALDRVRAEHAGK